MSKRPKLNRLFATASEVAEVTGYSVDTILRQTRNGQWPFVIGGGKGCPYRYRKSLVEAKLNLDPGTL